MNTQRAVEISVSPVMANVIYEGEQVYIQHVNEENNMARIYPLDHPQHEQNVPVHMLIEHE
ncbi:H-type small acid-soluble spore protein [Paenibacillus terrigena]|uniref:H-type small acid-soluble spore protein n=1 Tax=Paenibacillus terrigena TaxID=369333 RepID=UPI0028D6F066|nr:H-type small acid-soluble spore protein [Paenibacillus terrigena]